MKALIVFFNAKKINNKFLMLFLSLIVSKNSIHKGGPTKPVYKVHLAEVTANQLIKKKRRC